MDKIIKTMQTPEIKRLAKKLRSEKKRGFTWEELAREHKLTDEDGNPSAAWAWRIAHRHQPGLATLERWGIRTSCPHCKRRMPRSIPKWVQVGADFLAARDRERE